MAFIRKKTIKDQEYGYLVENKWHKGRSKQMVLKYLGKVIPMGSTQSQTISATTYAEAIDEVILSSLLSLGFEKHGQLLVLETTQINLTERTITSRKRPILLSCNEGFLCKETWEQLLALQAVTSPSGELLALRSLEAGLRLSPEAFVQLYELLSARADTLHL